MPKSIEQFWNIEVMFLLWSTAYYYVILIGVDIRQIFFLQKAIDCLLKIDATIGNAKTDTFVLPWFSVCFEHNVLSVRG